MTGIVILNYYTSADTIRLYHSIRNFPETFIIIVDNSSDEDERKAILDSIPSSQVIFNESNLGYAGGNNAGIRHLLDHPGIDQIVLLNPDIEVRSNILPLLIEPFQEKSRVGVTGPRLCLRDNENIIYSDGGIFRHDSFLKPGHINSGKNVENSSLDNDMEPDYVNGSFLVIKKEVLQDIGLFDESFFLYFEEADWCIRAKNSGWQLKTMKHVTAWQTISPKEGLYNYYFTRSWIRFLKRYDPDGVRHLIRIQLKKTIWVLTDKKRPLANRLKAAGYRLYGIISGIVRS